nr:MAG TPA: protein of unknown function (DUF383) [Caudoviricetes sp.]
MNPITRINASDPVIFSEMNKRFDEIEARDNEQQEQINVLNNKINEMVKDCSISAVNGWQMRGGFAKIIRNCCFAQIELYNEAPQTAVPMLQFNNFRSLSTYVDVITYQDYNWEDKVANVTLTSNELTWYEGTGNGVKRILVKLMLQVA